MHKMNTKLAINPCCDNLRHSKLKTNMQVFYIRVYVCHFTKETKPARTNSFWVVLLCQQFPFCQVLMGSQLVLAPIFPPIILSLERLLCCLAKNSNLRRKEGLNGTPFHSDSLLEGLSAYKLVDSDREPLNSFKTKKNDGCRFTGQQRWTITIIQRGS